MVDLFPPLQIEFECAKWTTKLLEFYYKTTP
ncbi:hypothetical protein V6Z11_D13G180700 [Gossypium hirsutum]